MTTLNLPWQTAKERLQARRADILGLEMVGLLHDLYKLRMQFLQTHSEKNWEADLMQAQVNGLKAYTVELGKFKGSLYELVIANPPADIASTSGLHGLAHFAKEKSEERFSQNLPDIFLGSTFGSETPVPQDPTALLKALPLENIGKITGSYAGYQEIQTGLQAGMSRGLADTRRPTHDVSLWDWGYIVAGFTKCLAAYSVIGEVPWMPEPRLRILSVALNALNAYQQTLAVSDLLGLQAEMAKAFALLQEKLTWEIPLATPLYADESGAYYLFPDYVPDPTFTEEIQAFFPPDLRPEVLFSEAIVLKDLDPNQGRQAIRSRQTCQKLIAEPRQRALNIEYPAPPPGLWQPEWQSQGAHPAEVCPVCGLRPIGYWQPGLEAWATAQKARERKICAVCLSRRGRRSQDWINDSRKYDNLPTIWMDEVADRNGRVALLAGGFDLQHWLDGRLFETTLIKNYGTVDVEPATKNATPARLLRLRETGLTFWGSIQQELPSSAGVRPVRLAFSVQRGDFGPSHAYAVELGGARLSVVWDGQRFISAHHLAYFARLLGEKIPDKYRDDLQGAERWAAGVIKAQLVKQGRSLKIYEPQGYGYATDRPQQVTLQGEPEILVQPYLPAIPVLAEPGMFMALLPADRALGVLEAIGAAYRRQMGKALNRLPLHLGVVYAPEHTPLRVLLESGRRMLKRCEQDGPARHWQIAQIDEIKAPDAGKQAPAQARRLSLQGLEDANRRVEWEIPLVMGDGSKDEWYPFVQLANLDSSADFALPAPWADDPNGSAKAHFIHAGRLKAGDAVHFIPAAFDVQWLGSAAQRFEIAYDAQGKRLAADGQPDSPRRPFLLDQLQEFERAWRAISGQLSVSQIYALRDTIEFKRREWPQIESDDTFRQLCRAALKQAGWKQKLWEAEDAFWTLEQWTDFAASGDLNAMLQIHLQILKEKVEDNSL